VRAGGKGLLFPPFSPSFPFLPIFFPSPCPHYPPSMVGMINDVREEAGQHAPKPFFFFFFSFFLLFFSLLFITSLPRSNPVACADVEKMFLFTLMTIVPFLFFSPFFSFSLCPPS